MSSIFPPFIVVTNGTIVDGELYDSTSYLAIDIFQFSFQLSSPTTTLSKSDLSNMANTLDALQLQDASANPLQLLQLSLANSSKVNISYTMAGLSSSQAKSYNLTCDPDISQTDKANRLETLVSSAQQAYAVAYYADFIATFDTLSFSNAHCGWPSVEIQNFALTAPSNCTLGTTTVNFINLNSYHVLDRAWTQLQANDINATLLANKLVIDRMVVFKFNSTNSIVSHFNSSGGWHFDTAVVKGDSLTIPSSDLCYGGSAFEMQILSFAIVGDYNDWLGGYNWADVAPALRNQLPGQLGIGNPNYFGQLKNQTLSSCVTVVTFPLYNFDGLDLLAHYGLDLSTVSSRFLNLLYYKQLIILNNQKSNTPLNISPVMTAPTNCSNLKIIIVDEYDAASAASLAAKLASEAAGALGIPSATITAPSIVAGQLYDGQTNLSVDVLQFSFYLADRGQFKPLLQLVNNGALQLTCSSGSICEIPADQDLYGSITYDLKGTTQLVTAYYDLTQRRSMMNVLRFDFACSASDLESAPSAEIVKQLKTSGSGATFKATLVQTKTPPCGRSAIFLYSFKLKILNDYETTVGDDSGPFLSSIEAQLIKLLNISSERLLSTSVDMVDVSGSFNGRPALLLPGVVQLTFNVYDVVGANATPFWSIMQFYNKDGNWLLKDLNGNALNVPPQYCRGELRLQLAVQTLQLVIRAELRKGFEDSVAIVARRKRQVGTAPDGHDSHTASAEKNTPSTKADTTLTNIDYTTTVATTTVTSNTTGADSNQLEYGLKKAFIDAKIAASLKKQLSLQLNVSIDSLAGFQMESGVDGTTIVSVNISSFSTRYMVDMSQANATFNQLLGNGTLKLVDASDRLLDISDVGGARVVKLVKLVIVAQFDAATNDTLAANLTGQLSNAMGLSTDRFADVIITAGELFDAQTNISADVLQLSTNLLIDYNVKDAKMANLSQLVANGALVLKDLNNSLLLVPPQQDLRGNVSHPVVIPPMAKSQSGQTRYNLGRKLVTNASGYDIGPLMNQTKSQLGGNPNTSLLVFYSTNLTLFDSGGCVEQPLVVGIEPITVTMLNDFDQVVDNATLFTDLIENQLSNLTNTPRDHLLAMGSFKIDIAGLANGNWSTSLLRDKVQVSFVKVSTDRNGSGVLFDRPFGLFYNGNRLNVPPQYKNGSTILPLVNQTVSMLIMYRYEWLLDGNSEKNFLTDLKNQLSPGKLINIPVDFFKNQQLIPNNSSTKFYLNISSYFNETVIDVQQLIGKFTDKLAGNKLAFKDSNNYPIHILPIDNPYKFIIIPGYDETFMKVWSPVVATVILILVILQFEIRACIKSCLKRRSTNKVAILPSAPQNLAGVDNEIKAIEKAIDEIGLNLRAIAKSQAQKSANNLPAGSYQVESGHLFLNPQTQIPEKASYAPPI